MFKVFLPKSKSCDLIQVVNICQMNFNFLFKVMGSYHNVLVLSFHNKTMWLNERIVIFLMLFALFYLSLVLLLIFGVKLCLLLFI